ncbi:MAG: antibiotic biosynthesis monooxygenase, partial [Methylocystis sp.]
IDWTHSEQFREAHKNAGQNRDLYIGGPEFEGFDSVLTEQNPNYAPSAAETDRSP